MTDFIGTPDGKLYWIRSRPYYSRHFMDSSKKPCHGKYDRISELPRNVLDYIFERMSIDASARTSIVSRNWRYIWASCPKLVFDEQFFKKFNTVNNKGIIQYEFPKAINKILFVHNGPVLEFSLHIPDIPNDLTPEIDQWMLFLSRNGIKKIDIKNSNRTHYILPSCIFSCISLIDMKLNNCILNPPYTFGSFHYLIKLSLERVSFSAGASATLMHNLPVLQTLTIKYCTGIDHKNIRAPKLNYLSMVECGDVYWQWFHSNKKLTVVQIVLGKEVNIVERNINMMKFLNPIIKTLWLDGFALKNLAAGNPPQIQTLAPTLLPFMTNVCIHNFLVDDIYQISSVLCLLKSCPNLLILELQIAASVNNGTEQVTEYLKPSNCMDLSLEKLQTVKIKSMNGLKSELLLIKLLLARSSSTRLKKMIIQRKSGISASDNLKISEELLRFPRSSSFAEIIFTDPLGAT